MFLPSTTECSLASILAGFMLTERTQALWWQRNCAARRLAFRRHELESPVNITELAVNTESPSV